jgi:hypothetical protein
LYFFGLNFTGIKQLLAHGTFEQRRIWGIPGFTFPENNVGVRAVGDVSFFNDQDIVTSFSAFKKFIN